MQSLQKLEAPDCSHGSWFAVQRQACLETDEVNLQILLFQVKPFKAEMENAVSMPYD